MTGTTATPAGAANDIIGLTMMSANSGNVNAYTTIAERCYLPFQGGNGIDRWGLTGSITYKFDSTTSVYFKAGYTTNNPQFTIFSNGALLISKLQ